MKLHSPQDLADHSNFSVEYIRRHAHRLGFVKLSENSRKWVATRGMIERALCPTSNQHHYPQTPDIPYRLFAIDKSPLTMKIEEIKAKEKLRRTEERKSRL